MNNEKPTDSDMLLAETLEHILDSIDITRSKRFDKCAQLIASYRAEQTQELREKKELYEHFYGEACKAVSWMHDDKSINDVIPIGSRLTIEGVKELKRQRDQFQQQLTTLRAKAEGLSVAVESIAEYWNGGSGSSVDAAEEMSARAYSALSAWRAQE